VKFHFDSTKLQFEGFSNALATDKFQEEPTPQDDTDNSDNDASTNKYVMIAWTSFTGNWPNATLPIKLVDLEFKALAAGSTSLKLSFPSVAAGYVGSSTPVSVTINASATDPVIDSLSPAEGPEAGATDVTITGQNFAAGATVQFGTADATAVNVVSATQITCKSPAGTGTVDVKVTVDGKTSNAKSFTYIAAAVDPVIDSLSPTEGPEAGSTDVTITGQNFVAGATVTFGTADATAINVVSATQITCKSPAGTGTVDVKVTVDAKTSNAKSFTYIAAAVDPVIDSLSPTEGPEAGSTDVTITGQNFAAGATVQFGTADATAIIVVSATQITCKSPAGTGTVDVKVTVDGKTSNAKQFTYKKEGVVEYTINVEVKGGEGTISPSGEVKVEQGQDKVFTITPASGYIVGTLLADGLPISLVAGGTYTFANVQEDHSIKVFFTNHHSADYFTDDFTDTTPDKKINLSELLRVIQFYNYSSGTYHCDISGEDGYMPGYGTNKDCMFHSSDYTHEVKSPGKRTLNIVGPDWTIDLDELLRVIQLYKYTCYQIDSSSADGFKAVTCP
jgi:hypothetical protein